MVLQVLRPMVAAILKRRVFRELHGWHADSIDRNMTFPNLERIDGVFSYCDRWCERCPFTTRCAIFAIEVATAMCDGDHEAGRELAIGPPPPMTADEESRREELIDAMNACAPTEAEAAAYSLQETARRERIEDTPAFTASTRAATLTNAWLDSHKDLDLSGNMRAAGALETARWDRHLIPVKLQRALRGLDEHTCGESAWDDPVQNDWNGTAKLTLICIRRSIEAWNALAEELGDAEAAAVSNELRSLQREVERSFPEAERFMRPGFDVDA